MVQKFMVEKSGAEKFMVENSGAERSGFEALGWKVRSWDVLQPLQSLEAKISNDLFFNISNMWNNSVRYVWFQNGSNPIIQQKEHEICLQHIGKSKDK